MPNSRLTPLNPDTNQQQHDMLRMGPNNMAQRGRQQMNLFQQQ